MIPAQLVHQVTLTNQFIPQSCVFAALALDLEEIFTPEQLESSVQTFLERVKPTNTISFKLSRLKTEFSDILQISNGETSLCIPISIQGI